MAAWLNIELQLIRYSYIHTDMYKAYTFTVHVNKINCYFKTTTTDSEMHTHLFGWLDLSPMSGSNVDGKIAIAN